MSDPSTVQPAVPIRDQLRERKLKNRLLIEEKRGRLLERQAKRDKVRMESYDWVTPYVDLVDRLRTEPNLSGPTNAWQRRGGKNYPFYQTETELGLYRAASRMLIGTNDYARGLTEGVISYTLGTGISYEAVKRKGHEDLPDELVEECQRHIDEFLEREQWYGGELPGIEEESVYRWIEDGEYWQANYCDDEAEGDAKGDTLVRILEPEQITRPTHLSDDGYDWSFGVKTRKDDAQIPLAYWVAWSENVTDGDELKPDELVCWRKNVKRGMKRGMPDFVFDAYDGLELASKLRTNLADGAAEQAAIVGVRQHKYADAQQIEDFVDGQKDFDSPDRGGTQRANSYKQRGRWEDISDGLEYVSPPNATNGPTHIQILDACLRGAGRRWCAPEWIFGNASNNPYASSLTAESPFVKCIERAQRSVCAVHRTTMLTVLKNKADAGRIVAGGQSWSWDDLRKVIDVKATAPSPRVRDGLIEAQKAQIEIPLGVESKRNYAATQGRDYDEIEKEIQEELQATGGMGAQLPIPGEGGMDAQESIFFSDDLSELDLLEEELTDEELGDVEDRASVIADIIGGLFGDDALDFFDDVEESLVFEDGSTEQDLLEEGFSGEKKDKLGRTYTYRDGKRVKGNKKEPEKGSEGDSKKGSSEKGSRGIDPDVTIKTPLQKDPKRWTQDGVNSALDELGVKRGQPKYDLKTKKTTSELTFPDGSKEKMDSAQVREMIKQHLPGAKKSGSAKPVAKQPAKGSAQAAEVAKAKVAEVLKGKKTAATQKKLTEHLSALTVRQLGDLKKEHGLKASGATKAALTEKIAERLTAKMGDSKLKAKPPVQKKPEAKAKPTQAEPKSKPKEGSDFGKMSPTQKDSAIRDAWDHQSMFKEHEGGLVTVPRLYKEMESRHPGMSVQDFHKELKRMSGERSLELHVENSPNLVKDHHLAMQGGTKDDPRLFYYVRFRQ